MQFLHKCLESLDIFEAAGGLIKLNDVARNNDPPPFTLFFVEPPASSMDKNLDISECNTGKCCQNRSSNSSSATV